MAEDLDDFELERTRRDKVDDEDGRLYRPLPENRRGGRTFPLTVAAVAVVAIGLLAVMFFVFRTPAKKPVPQAAAPGAAPAAPAATPEVAGPSPLTTLPALETSDAFARTTASALSSHPEFARWLGQASLVPTLTAVVSNVADGETPRPHLGFLAPSQRFRAGRGAGGRIVPDRASFGGYDRFADAVASVDAQAAASAFTAMEPLFDSAYRDLGHPGGGFRKALLRAIDALLAVPILPAEVELVPHAIGFRYVDPRLESLSPAQKQFLRTGPRNVRLVQEKLRELRPALARG